MVNKTWIQRWEDGETGFHQSSVNSYLTKHWPKLNAPAHSTVFIPLCGKTLDILWLAKQNLNIIGIELSEIAIKAFFEENSLTYKTSSTAKFKVYESENIKLICGDFFDLTSEDFPDNTNIFDRAALIALPPEMRNKYAAHLIHILPKSSKTLLICMEYDQKEMSGPPYSVTPEELKQLYGKTYQIEAIQSEDIMEDEPRFKARGLSKLEEKVYLLRSH